jgi:hypothetical protein
MTEPALVINRATFQAAEGGASALPTAIRDVIQAITSRVAAPEYVRTPQFARRARRGARDSRAGGGEWVGTAPSGPAQNFKSTRLQKRDGIEGAIDRLRKHINKMSDRTYSRLRDKAFAEIDGQSGAADSSDVSEALLDLVSSNAFYAQLYASFYTALLERYPQMRVTLETQLGSATRALSEVTYCDPKVDYDKFCDNNRLNARRRASGLFYVHLAARGIVTVDEVATIIRSLQVSLAQTPMAGDTGPVRDELSELLFQMLSPAVAVCLRRAREWGAVRRAVEDYATNKPDATRGLTGKSVFRHMDILDALRSRKGT